MRPVLVASTIYKHYSGLCKLSTTTITELNMVALHGRIFHRAVYGKVGRGTVSQKA